MSKMIVYPYKSDAQMDLLGTLYILIERIAEPNTEEPEDPVELFDEVIFNLTLTLQNDPNLSGGFLSTLTDIIVQYPSLRPTLLREEIPQFFLSTATIEFEDALPDLLDFLMTFLPNDRSLIYCAQFFSLLDLTARLHPQRAWDIAMTLSEEEIPEEFQSAFFSLGRFDTLPSQSFARSLIENLFLHTDVDLDCFAGSWIDEFIQNDIEISPYLILVVAAIRSVDPQLYPDTTPLALTYVCSIAPNMEFVPEGLIGRATSYLTLFREELSDEGLKDLFTSLYSIAIDCDFVDAYDRLCCIELLASIAAADPHSIPLEMIQELLELIEDADSDYLADYASIIVSEVSDILT